MEQLARAESDGEGVAVAAEPLEHVGEHDEPRQAAKLDGAQRLDECVEVGEEAVEPLRIQRSGEARARPLHRREERLEGDARRRRLQSVGRRQMGGEFRRADQTLDATKKQKLPRPDRTHMSGYVASLQMQGAETARLAATHAESGGGRETPSLLCKRARVEQEAEVSDALAARRELCRVDTRIDQLETELEELKEARRRLNDKLDHIPGARYAPTSPTYSPR